MDIHIHVQTCIHVLFITFYRNVNKLKRHHFYCTRVHYTCSPGRIFLQTQTFILKLALDLIFGKSLGMWKY